MGGRGKDGCRCQAGRDSVSLTPVVPAAARGSGPLPQLQCVQENIPLLCHRAALDLSGAGRDALDLPRLLVRSRCSDTLPADAVPERVVVDSCIISPKGWERPGRPTTLCGNT